MLRDKLEERNGQKYKEIMTQVKVKYFF